MRALRQAHAADVEDDRPSASVPHRTAEPLTQPRVIPATCAYAASHVGGTRTHLTRVLVQHTAEALADGRVRPVLAGVREMLPKTAVAIVGQFPQPHVCETFEEDGSAVIIAT